VSEAEGLYTQAHSEQPKPRKRISSIHTSLRGIRLSASVCDTSHSSSGEYFGGGNRQGRNAFDIDSAVMMPTDGVQNQ
jgi:hypothetical protein